MEKMTTRTKQVARAGLKSLQPQCGECIGLKCEKLIPDNKHVCSENGKTRTSRTCNYFIADTKPLANLTRKTAFDQLVSLFQEIPDKGLRELASLLYNEKKTRRAGYYFGQKVYVRYRGAANADYMSNFMSAIVISASSEYMRLTSLDGRCNLTFAKGCFPHILTVEKFDALRTKMIARGRLVDPDTEKLIAKRFRAEEEYELQITTESKNGQITTIDTVFKENKVPRRKGKKTVDLVDLVNGVMAGHNVKKSATKYERSKKSRRDDGKDTIIAVSGD